MTRKYPASVVDRSLATKYLDKAIKFKADAEKMLDLSDEFSGSGVAVLCVHAAIAYGDALAIFAAGKKSKSGDHKDAVPFLSSVIKVQTAEDNAAMRALRTLLARKDEVSYMQVLVSTQEAKVLLEKLQTFARWAEKTFRNLQKGAR